jgi:hypothetical protein
LKKVAVFGHFSIGPEKDQARVRKVSRHNGGTIGFGTLSRLWGFVA